MSKTLFVLIWIAILGLSFAFMAAAFSFAIYQLSLGTPLSIVYGLGTFWGIGALTLLAFFIGR